MSFFDDSAYLSLEEEIKQKAITGEPEALEDLNYLKNAVMIFANYVYKVDEEQIETRLAKSFLKGEELREVVSHFDSTRHTAHEQAIVQARILNRLASAYGVNPVFLGDQSNRREIGHFCGEITKWFFDNRYN